MDAKVSGKRRDQQRARIETDLNLFTHYLVKGAVDVQRSHRLEETMSLSFIDFNKTRALQPRSNTFREDDLQFESESQIASPHENTVDNILQELEDSKRDSADIVSDSQMIESAKVFLLASINNAKKSKEDPAEMDYRQLDQHSKCSNRRATVNLDKSTLSRDFAADI